MMGFLLFIRASLSAIVSSWLKIQATEQTLIITSIWWLLISTLSVILLFILTYSTTCFHNSMLELQQKESNKKQTKHMNRWLSKVIPKKKKQEHFRCSYKRRIQKVSSTLFNHQMTFNSNIFIKIRNNMNKFDYADGMPILDENTMRNKRRTETSECQFLMRTMAMAETGKHMAECKTSIFQ